MKKIMSLITAAFLSGCVSLSYQEKVTLRQIQQRGFGSGISANGWEKPISPLLAGTLNILPGFGNFYLGSGKAADSIQIAYGIGNLLLWPLSVIWSVPQAYIDAQTLNDRDLVFFFQYVANEQKNSDFFNVHSTQKTERPQWVDLFEKEGYIGQTDKRAIYYIGYGESILYQPAHDYAVDDAYEKAMASITGYGVSLKKIPIRGMRLLSEYKEEIAGKFKVWVLYRYPKIQMEKDILDFQNKNKNKKN